jgi:mannose-6-phosphate isomerase-like protein (cupin superfamily)
MRTRYAELPAHRAKDGSLVRELMHPHRHGNRRQSLTEAIVAAGAETLLHMHRTSEELYHITRGEGSMTLGDQRFEVAAGDTVLIPPGTPHCIRNTGAAPLHVLCSCSPAYADDDTVLLTGDDGAALA